jgi:hypothetical protein
VVNIAPLHSMDIICIVCPIASNIIKSPLQPLPLCMATISSYTDQYIAVFAPHIAPSLSTQSLAPSLFLTPLQSQGVAEPQIAYSLAGRQRTRCWYLSSPQSPPKSFTESTFATAYLPCWENRQLCTHTVQVALVLHELRCEDQRC